MAKKDQRSNDLGIEARRTWSNVRVITQWILVALFGGLAGGGATFGGIRLTLPDTVKNAQAIKAVEERVVAVERKTEMVAQKLDLYIKNNEQVGTIKYKELDQRLKRLDRSISNLNQKMDRIIEMMLKNKGK